MGTRTLIRIRKWLSLVGILSILSGLIVMAPVASAYSGADAPSWAKDKVDNACERELIDCELADPGFAKPVDRATGYQMITKGFDVYSDTAMSPFTDVSGKWWEGAAHTAYTLGWTVGKNGKFMPGDSFTRAQMSVAVKAVIGLPNLTQIEAKKVLAKFIDGGSTPDWAVIPMAAMVKAELIGQGGNAQLRPNDAVTKIETIVIQVATVEKAEDEGTDVVQVAVDRINEANGLDLTTEDLLSAMDEGLVFDPETKEFVAFEEVTPPVGEEEEVPPGEEEEVPPVITGSASVAVANTTPKATILASGTAFNPAFTLSVTAGSDADVKLNGFTVSRSGLSSNANVAGVGVYDASDVRHGNIGTSWNDNNTMDIDFTSDPITIAKGTTAPIVLKVNLATGAMSGTLVLTIAAATDVKSSAATLDGTFPLSSNQFDLRDGSNTVATITVDDVQVHNNGATDVTAVSVNLGTTRQQLGTFRLANSAVEAVTLASLTLYNNGSAADGDVKNLTLVGPDGTDLKVVEKTTNKYAVFSGLNYLLAKSASAKDFKLYGDVTGGSTRTVRFLIQNDYDLVLEGVSSKAMVLATVVGGATPTGNDRAFPVGDQCGGAATNYCNQITVSAGTLSFSKSPGSPTGNVAAGGSGIILGRFDAKAIGEDMEIRQMSYRIGSSSATAMSGTLYFKIREVGTSTTSTTLYSVAGASAVYAPTAVATVTTTFVKLTSGKDYYIEVVGDINSTTAANSTFTVGPIDITQVKRMNTNDIVDPAVNTATANTLTVKTGTLTVSANSGASAPQVVAGQATLTTLGTWDFTAGAGEGISLTNVAVGTSTGAQMGVNVKECEMWIDGVKRSTDTSSTVTIPATATSVTFNISPSYSIAASQTAVVEVKCKMMTTAPAGTATFTIAASGVTGTGITSQTALSSVPASAVSGQLVTINTSGTLTVSRDTVTNVKASQIVAGTTNVTFGAYKLQTGNIEDIKLKKITVRNIGSNTNGVVSIGIYDGSTLVGNITKASLGSDSQVLGNDTKSVTFDYSADPYIIAKNSYKVLTVKANTVYGATSAQTVQLVMDSIDAEGAGSAVKIYPALTTESLAASTTTNAYAAGEVVVWSNGVPLGSLLGTSTFVAPVTTAVAAGGSTTAAASGLVAGLTTGPGGTSGGLTNRITKLNPVMFGSAIVSEVYSTATTYSYAAGDVVAVSDNNGTSTTGLAVVTTAVAAGGTLAGAGILIAGETLAANDRITRIPSGFSELASAAAGTNYSAGEIVVLTSSATSTNNGVYVVKNAVSQGGSLISGAATARLINVRDTPAGGLAITDRVAKLATATTEAPSTASVYAYAVGDVVVVDDDSTPTNNGIYVVRTALAVSGDLTGADALGTGITFTTSDRVSKLYVKSQDDNLKRLYPTKLNFAWVTPTSTTLTTGNQIEVARFTMGADAANVNNPDAAVSVSALNLTELSTATLTNFTLKDYTLNSNAASGASSSSFTSATAGGTMTAIALQQGETRTFTVLADVATNAGSQVAQFKYTAGTQFSTVSTTGVSTWAVSVTGQTTNTSYWTVLASDAADVLSATLTAASSATDATAPTISTIVFTEGGAAGSSTSFDAGDYATLTFSEKLDPATINASMTYGGSVTSVAQTGTAGISATVAGTTSTFTFANITTVAVGCASATPVAVTASTSTLGLDATGTILTVTTTAVTGGSGGTGADNQCGASAVWLLKAAGTTVAGTIKDAAGNALAAAASPVPTGGY